jgi:UMP-CMP kinase
LYLDGPEDIMVKRLAGRGRSDDNEETVKKRLQVNKRDAQPVVEYYEKLNKVRKISCDNTPEGVPPLIAWLLTCVSCV